MSNDVDPIPPPDRCPHCNSGTASRPFVAPPNENVTWVTYYCGTTIWEDEYESRGKKCMRIMHEYVVGVDYNSAYPGDKVKLSGGRTGVITSVRKPLEQKRATVVISTFDAITGKDLGEVSGNAVTLGLRVDRS